MELPFRRMLMVKYKKSHFLADCFMATAEFGKQRNSAFP